MYINLQEVKAKDFLEIMEESEEDGFQLVQKQEVTEIVGKR